MAASRPTPAAPAGTATARLTRALVWRAPASRDRGFRTVRPPREPNQPVCGISRLATAPDFPFDPDLLRHVSPIEWKNVILYGEIKIDPAKLKMRRP